MLNLREFSGTADLDRTLAQDIVIRLRNAVADRGHASLIVSGGSTPIGLFNQLSRADLDWQHITVALADERWVNDTHADRNERMLKSELLRDNAAHARFISLAAEYPDLEKSIAEARSALTEIGRFDVVILGMGTDGHTASLFPCATETSVAFQSVEGVETTQPTTAPHRRITLTPKRLRDTDFGVIHIVGEKKLAVLTSAIARQDTLSAPIIHFTPPDGAFTTYYAP
jgi:6-phosphogluconolactonase